ncbi:hypothetical protein Tco_0523544 [Tanacetum coccineum]
MASESASASTATGVGSTSQFQHDVKGSYRIIRIVKPKTGTAEQNYGKRGKRLWARVWVVFQYDPDYLSCEKFGVGD